MSRAQRKMELIFVCLHLKLWLSVFLGDRHCAIGFVQVFTMKNKTYESTFLPVIS